MSEVAKMYENVGVKVDRIVCYRGFDNCFYNDFNCHCHNEKPCKDAAKIYPPFTAEKQLELIKWLAKTGDVCRIDATVKNKWFVENEVNSSNCFAKFEEALANVINIIWEYMPEEEKQEIKRILE